MTVSQRMDLTQKYAKAFRGSVGEREISFVEFTSAIKFVETVAGFNAKDPLFMQPILQESISRATLLLALMVLQSASALVLERYESLLKEHVVIVLFLTMLVGAGGNAGNQSVIKVIEQLISGQLQVTQAACAQILLQQLVVGAILAIILGTGGFVRAFVTQYYFRAPDTDTRNVLHECIAVTAALVTIVITSVVLGTCLPLALAAAGMDVAHAGPSIQVLMDIGGVIITCSIACRILKPDPWKL